MDNTLSSFTDVLDDEIDNSQPISFPSSVDSNVCIANNVEHPYNIARPTKGTGQRGHFRSIEEIDKKYRDVFTYPYFNLVQSKVIDDALYSDKSMVVCAPTGSGKTVVFEMAIVQLLMELEDKNYTEDFKIIYMAPVKALCTERLTEWYPKFTKYGLLCIEATGDTDVDFNQLKPYKIIITTPEKWDMLTRRWRDHRSLVEVIKLFLIDEVHILNDECRGPVLEAVVSRMKTIESSAQSVYRIEQLQNQLQGSAIMTHKTAPSIRFVAVSATVSNPEDVANWLGTSNKPAVFHKFGDECRPVKLRRIVEGYPCPNGASIFKFDIILNYKLWPIIQKYHSGKPTLIFCNTRKSVTMTAETLAKELTINFNAEQKAKLTALAMTIKTKKLQSLVMSGVGCHHAGLLYEERQIIESAFRNRDLPILITTTTLAMGVNLPAHLVIIKNTQQYVNGAYQEYSISTVLQMVGRAGRPQFDTEATAVIMTRLADKGRYQALVGGCEPLQSYLHKRLPENLNSEAALGTVGDVAQCVEWLRSTFLYVRASRDPKKYLNLPPKSPQNLISKKIEELCVKAMNGLASSGLITMDEASCIESTEAGRLMSIFYLDVETMKLLMKIEGTENLERLLTLICESHELSDMHLRMDERRNLNALNRNNAATTIRFPMKGKISTRQMKLNCLIQAVLGCLPIPDPALNQEAMKIMRIADRVCKCLVAYVTRPDLISRQPQFYSAVLNSIILAKCILAHLWENSPFVSKQLKGIGPTFSTLLATAGKINFLLLEESHPRDLERIMNKNAPAGNVLRKQVSLLPKYQLTIMPVDESTITIQLVLLNQHFLSENMDQLTAGGSHKSYIVVGDSENHLLLLAPFKDSDLIRVFDGIITHEIRRKHNHEHKIIAHCISTTFVGIDVQSEFLFNDLNQFFGSPVTTFNNKIPIKETAKKQTCITDTFKERKRKSTTSLDTIQSKEKKKRDNALFESFNYLKKTFETASKNVRENVNLSTNKQALPNSEFPSETELDIIDGNHMIKEYKNDNSEIEIIEDTDDDIVDSEKIDSILTEIENEMTKKRADVTNNSLLLSNSIKQVYITPSHTVSKTQVHSKANGYKSASDMKKRKNISTKSNYTFIELLERNLDLSDDENKIVDVNENNGFSETIKTQISKYIQNAAIKTTDNQIQLLIENDDKQTLSINRDVSNEIIDLDSEGALLSTQPCIKGHKNKTSDYNKQLNEAGDKLPPNINKDLNEIINLLSDSEEALPPTQILYPRYEIKEILDGQSDFVTETVDNKRENVTTVQCNEPIPLHYKIPLCDTVISTFAPSLLKKDSSNQSNINEIYNLNEPCTVEENSTKLHDQRDVMNDTSDKFVLDNIEFETETINSCEETDNMQDQHREEVTTVLCNEPILLHYKIPACDTVISTFAPSFVNKDSSDQSNINEICNLYEPCTVKENVVNCDVMKDNSDKFLLDNIEFETETTNSSEETNDMDQDFKIQQDLDKYVTKKESINPSLIPFQSLDAYKNNDFSGQKNITNKDTDKTIIKSNLTLQPLDDKFSNIKYKLPQNTMKKLSINYDKLPTVNNETLSINTSTLDFEIPRIYVPNLVQSSQSNYDVVNINNNVCEYDTNNSSDQYNKNNRDQIKNYSYSTTNIDVCTKQLAKYSVRIIKKVKMDLNITEIISTNQIRGNENVESENNGSVMKYDKDTTELNAIKDRKKLVNVLELTDDNIQKPGMLYSKCDQEINNWKEPVTDIINTNDSNINKHNVTKHSNQIIRTNLRDTLDNEIQKPTKGCIKSPLPVITATNSTVNEIKENDLKEEEKCNVVENDKLQNILLKYSKILRKHTAASPKPSPDQSSVTKNVTVKRLPVEKITKPFKINNIQKLHANLPKTLINCNNQNVGCTSTFTKVVETPCVTVNPGFFESEETLPCQPRISFNLEPIHIPENIDLEPITDLNIDQLMFDPKTLLQSSIDADYEEIIPPPVQFCDDIALPDDSVAEDSCIEVNDNKYDQSFNADFSIDNLKYNESIFEDNCVSNLTPSREIETWTLAEHDSWEDRHSSPFPAKSFTVMRKNTSNCSNLLVNNEMVRSRQAKLGQFKFNHKTKLKPWK